MKKYICEIAEELWHIQHPDRKKPTFSPEEAAQFLERDTGAGQKAIRTGGISLTYDQIQILSTSRNQLLISGSEQQVLRAVVAGFFGLSVGSHAAITWIMLSRADVVKIIDPDTVSPTNLNRIRTGWNQVGKKKTSVVHRTIHDISPTTYVQSFSHVSDQQTAKVFGNFPKLNIVIDEVDDLAEKVRLRLLAREHKIPLLSATDVGDTVLLDVERYDKEKNLELFLGRVPGIENVNLSSISIDEYRTFVGKIIGPHGQSSRMTKSLRSIGRDIVTWPQLGSTATVAGGFIAATIKNIFLKSKISSGRYVLSLDDMHRGKV